MFKRTLWATLAAATAVASMQAGVATAADHGDAPIVASDRGADVNDCFAFLDPNDNSQVVLIFTVHGFIPAGESVNFGVFDPLIQYSFRLQQLGNARPDNFINVQFSRRTSTATAQTATVSFSNGPSFTAPATNPSLATVAPTQVVTVDPSGVSFFAGQVDDPFFFDIPAFSRLIASIAAGATDVTTLDRGRDSFAGYNTLSIALSMPATMLTTPANPIVAVDCATSRKQVYRIADGSTRETGAFHQLDRMGNPAVNVALIPFANKDRHSSSGAIRDQLGDFNADITGTMNFLGTAPATQAAILGIVANRGDYLRLDTTVANTGTGGGNNPGAGFPNGRRLADDTIDTLLNLLTNGGITQGDNVDANDVTLGNTFPFLAASQQPRVPGVTDDNTRN